MAPVHEEPGVFESWENNYTVSRLIYTPGLIGVYAPITIAGRAGVFPSAGI